MSVRLLLIALVVAMLLAIKPKHRRPALGMAGVIVLLIVWQLFEAAHEDRSAVADMQAVRTRSPSASPADIPGEQSKDQISLQDMMLSGNGAPWSIQGKISNRANVVVRSVKIRITRLSCSSELAVDETCQLVWQGDDEIRKTIQPGTSVEFAEKIWTHTPVSRSVSGLRDTFEVIKVESLP